MEITEASTRGINRDNSCSFNWRNLLLPIGIFVLAFLLRFVYLLQIKSSLPFFYSPILDELYHDTWAKQIASGNWIGTEPFFRAPLYIYLLALVYKIFGHNLFLPRLFQIILGSTSCVLIFLITKKLFNRTVAILSGVIASFYAMLIFYDAQLMFTSLIVFFDLALIGLLILTAEKPKPLNWLICGIILGLSAITRPDVLVFLPFILIWMFFHFKSKLCVKTILTRWVILGIGVMLMITPVAVRNYIVGKDVVLIAWQGGFNFYLGNHPHASGWSVMAPQIDPTLVGVIKDAKRLAEEETKTKLKPSQISGFWYRKGADFIISQPLSWFKLMGKKALYFWKGYEIPNDQNIYFYKDFSSLFDILLGKHIIYFPFGLVGPLSIWGFIICLRNLRRYLLLYLFVLSYSAAVILFFVCSRFRMPVIPFLIMFASFSIWWLIQKIKNKKILPVLISLIVVALLMLTLNPKLENLLGDQRSTDHFNLGWSYRQLGKINLAIGEWEASLKLEPQLNLTRINLARTYSDLGLTDQAIKEYNTALTSDTSFHDFCYYSLGAIYHRKGDLDKATEYYLKSIEVNPRSEHAWFMLGQAYYDKGWFDEAKEVWEKVLELNPDNEDVRKLLGK